MYGKKSNDPRLSMSTAIIAGTYPRGLHGYRRGMGDTAVVLSNGARVSGGAARSNLRFPINRPDAPVSRPSAPATKAPQNRFQRGGSGGIQPGGTNLAQLQQIAQTNPASLTPQQFAMLQAAGTIPNTLPYSSASLLPTPTTAADTTTAVVSTDALGGLSTDYSGLPLWGWIGLAVGGIYFFTSRSGRR